LGEALALASDLQRVSIAISAPILTLIGLFGSGTTSAFGQPQQNNTTSAFGQPSAFGANPNTTSAFGAAANPSGGLFGSKPAPTGFGGSAFGSAATPFGGNTSAFGNAANTNAQTGFGSCNIHFDVSDIQLPLASARAMCL
jgi:hypothetical protein